MMVSGNSINSENNNREETKMISKVPCKETTEIRPRGRSLNRIEIEDGNLLLDFTQANPTVTVIKSHTATQQNLSPDFYKNQVWLNSNHSLDRLSKPILHKNDNTNLLNQRNDSKTVKFVSFDLSNCNNNSQITKNPPSCNNNLVSRPILSTRDLIEEYNLYNTQYNNDNSNHLPDSSKIELQNGYVPSGKIVHTIKQPSLPSQYQTGNNRKQENEQEKKLDSENNSKSQYVNIAEMTAKIERLYQNLKNEAVKDANLKISAVEQPQTVRKEEDNKSNAEKHRIVLSSAVQTELTCIPIKGIKNSRWNSVETLLSTPIITSSCTRDAKISPTTRVKPILRELSVPPLPHHKEIHCERNCKNCFYI